MRSPRDRQNANILAGDLLQCRATTPIARCAGAARIISTVSNPEKAALAGRLGADVTVDYKSESVAERIMELTAEAHQLVEQGKTIGNVLIELG